MAFARMLGMFAEAPERLKEIAVRASHRMDIPFRNVRVIRSGYALAFAVVGTRHLLFSERLLEGLSDEEISTVCAHDLAHLTESRSARVVRSSPVVAYLPWIFFRPLTSEFGLTAFAVLLVFSVVLPPSCLEASRKMESRADGMAKKEEEAPAVYARAMARLCEDARSPVVTTKAGTHPHLYDRLVAAGVTPDYPRPAPAAAMTWMGKAFGFLAASLFGLLAMRVIG